MVIVAALGIGALGVASHGSDSPLAGSGPVSFGAGERARILALGPWPLPAATAADASGAAGARIALGEQLFHSARLGGGGGVRCASCHEPFRAFTDGRPRAEGRAAGSRNTPTLLNVGARRVFGWDGARDRLDAQSLRPMRDPAEMAATPAHVAALVRGDAPMRARFIEAFGRPPGADDEAVFADVGRALAAFEATLASAPTPFDAWRAAFAAGAPAGTAPLPVPALRGLRLFVGAAGCVACHAGPIFSDDALHVSTIRSLRADGSADTGHPGRPDAFRTPSLREVAATAPYMHDGSIARLCDAVRAHTAPELGTARPIAPSLTAAEREDLVAFLLTLNAGERAASDDAETCT